MKKISIFFLIVSLVLVGMGIFDNRHSFMLERKCTETATGEVVEVYENVDDVTEGQRYEQKYKTFYDITVNFEAADGTVWYSGREHLTTNPGEGSKLNVKYDPDSPSTNYISDYPLEKGMGCFLFAAFPFVLSIICFAGHLIDRRKKNV